ncbi:MAG: hypothetical protein OEZ22_09160 [Spirochaetia bacterium]|nr:hypothetical protein [Spirochaetia bacterium]
MMNKNKYIIIIFFTIIVKINAESPGRFLQLQTGAKNNGLGGAYEAVVKDPSSLFINPAGLANINGDTKMIERTVVSSKTDEPFNEDPFSVFNETTDEKNNTKDEKEVQIQSAERPFEFQFYNGFSQLTLDRQVVSTAVGFTAFGGTLGAGATGTRVQGIEGYDSQGNMTEKLSYQAMAAFLGFAYENGSSRLGISVNGLQENIGKNDISGGALNAGFQISPLPFIDAGASIQNLAGMIQSNTIEKNKYEKLDTIFSASLGVKTLPPKSNILLLASIKYNIDADENSESLSYNLGAALSINKYAYLMGGISNGDIAAGIGFNINFIQAAYSINKDPLHTGYQHFIDLNFVY